MGSFEAMEWRRWSMSYYVNVSILYKFGNGMLKQVNYLKNRIILLYVRHSSIGRSLGGVGFKLIKIPKLGFVVLDLWLVNCSLSILIRWDILEQCIGYTTYLVENNFVHSPDKWEYMIRIVKQTQLLFLSSLKSLFKIDSLPKTTKTWTVCFNHSV